MYGLLATFKRHETSSLLGILFKSWLNRQGGRVGMGDGTQPTSNKALLYTGCSIVAGCLYTMWCDIILGL